MGQQAVAQTIITIVLLLLITLLFLPTRRGARPLALRRLTYLALLLAAIAAVLYPAWLTAIAEIIGIGRGADLLLYGLILVFISHSIQSKSRHAATDRRFTALARAMALELAEPAEAAGQRLTKATLDPAAPHAPAADTTAQKPEDNDPAA